MKLETHYQPDKFEKERYEDALKNKVFQADPSSGKEPYTIVIPPPNITGRLHMGHALNNTLQDILIRHKRMRGFNVLWVPGTDHAGIATQNVVERSLENGITRHTIGREEFVNRVWKWREEYGTAIIGQLKKLGASCDWSRERFTMDEGLSRAVRYVFVSLYKKGLIYKGNYIINWCPRCGTALADDEVDHQEIDGAFYHIKYFFENSDDFVSIATTRPETMLGDTAVAVHPKDKRYKDLVGKNVILPLVNRKLKIISDNYVDPEFGTGALKITPAHDPNDYLIGRKHNLEEINILTDNALINKNGGKYEGMTCNEARKKIVEDLEAQEFLIKIEPYKHNVGHCYRCTTLIEPYLSKQWFVKTKPLAKMAIEAVEQKRIKIVPVHWEKTYFQWMNEIRDWCISRQIWWGHRIPAWICSSCGELTVQMDDPDKCAKCGSGDIKQDPDVLDTWFSSALWPFSTLGWPDETPELKKYYPTSCLVTGFDILFFWVARMIMMGLEFMDDVPFHNVYIHALVRDAEGRKMSKSKGNVIDPLEIIDRHGADAFRFTLASLATPGRDVLLSEPRIAGYRHFCNKIWNASRFILMNFEKSDDSVSPSLPALTDRWIVSRKNRVIKAVTSAIETYRFDDAAHELYHFFWHEFCDWYLELIKPRINGDDEPDKARAVKTFLSVLTEMLKCLHPFTPFITDELMRHLRPGEKNIALMDWPEVSEEEIDTDAESKMNTIMQLTNTIRSLRTDLGVPPKDKIHVYISADDPDSIAPFKENIALLAGAVPLEIKKSPFTVPHSIHIVVDSYEVILPIEGNINLDSEIERVRKEIEKLNGFLINTRKKLENDNFIQKAPEEVVEETKEKEKDFTIRIARWEEHLKRLKDAKQ